MIENQEPENNNSQNSLNKKDETINLTDSSKEGEKPDVKNASLKEKNKSKSGSSSSGKGKKDKLNAKKSSSSSKEKIDKNLTQNQDFNINFDKKEDQNDQQEIIYIEDETVEPAKKKGFFLRIGESIGELFKPKPEEELESTESRIERHNTFITNLIELDFPLGENLLQFLLFDANSLLDTQQQKFIENLNARILSLFELNRDQEILNLFQTPGLYPTLPGDIKSNLTLWLTEKIAFSLLDHTQRKNLVFAEGKALLDFLILLKQAFLENALDHPCNKTIDLWLNIQISYAFNGCKEIIIAAEKPKDLPDNVIYLRQIETDDEDQFNFKLYSNQLKKPKKGSFEAKKLNELFNNQELEILNKGPFTLKRSEDDKRTGTLIDEITFLTNSVFPNPAMDPNERIQWCDYYINILRTDFPLFNEEEKKHWLKLWVGVKRYCLIEEMDEAFENLSTKNIDVFIGICDYYLTVLKQPIFMEEEREHKVNEWNSAKKQRLINEMDLNYQVLSPLSFSKDRIDFCFKTCDDALAWLNNHFLPSEQNVRRTQWIDAKRHWTLQEIEAQYNFLMYSDKEISQAERLNICTNYLNKIKASPVIDLKEKMHLEKKWAGLMRYGVHYTDALNHKFSKIDKQNPEVYLAWLKPSIYADMNAYFDPRNAALKKECAIGIIAKIRGPKLPDVEIPHVQIKEQKKENKQIDIEIILEENPEENQKEKIPLWVQARKGILELCSELFDKHTLDNFFIKELFQSALIAADDRLASLKINQLLKELDLDGIVKFIDLLSQLSYEQQSLLIPGFFQLIATEDKFFIVSAACEKSRNPNFLNDWAISHLWLSTKQHNFSHTSALAYFLYNAPTYSLKKGFFRFLLPINSKEKFNAFMQERPILAANLNQIFQYNRLDDFDIFSQFIKLNEKLLKSFNLKNARERILSFAHFVAAGNLSPEIFITCINSIEKEMDSEFWYHLTSEQKELLDQKREAYQIDFLLAQFFDAEATARELIRVLGLEEAFNALQNETAQHLFILENFKALNDERFALVLTSEELTFKHYNFLVGRNCIKENQFIQLLNTNGHKVLQGFPPTNGEIFFSDSYLKQRESDKKEFDQIKIHAEFDKEANFKARTITSSVIHNHNTFEQDLIKRYTLTFKWGVLDDETVERLLKGEFTFLPSEFTYIKMQNWLNSTHIETVVSQCNQRNTHPNILKLIALYSDHKSILKIINPVNSNAAEIITHACSLVTYFPLAKRKIFLESLIFEEGFSNPLFKKASKYDQNFLKEKYEALQIYTKIKFSTKPPEGKIEKDTLYLEYNEKNQIIKIYSDGLDEPQKKLNNKTFSRLKAYFSSNSILLRKNNNRKVFDRIISLCGYEEKSDFSIHHYHYKGHSLFNHKIPTPPTEIDFLISQALNDKEILTRVIETIYMASLDSQGNKLFAFRLFILSLHKREQIEPKTYEKILDKMISLTKKRKGVPFVSHINTLMSLPLTPRERYNYLMTCSTANQKDKSTIENFLYKSCERVLERDPKVIWGLTEETSKFFQENSAAIAKLTSWVLERNKNNFPVKETQLLSDIETKGKKKTEDSIVYTDKVPYANKVFYKEIEDINDNRSLTEIIQDIYTHSRDDKMPIWNWKGNGYSKFFMYVLQAFFQEACDMKIVKTTIINMKKGQPLPDIDLNNQNGELLPDINLNNQNGGLLPDYFIDLNNHNESALTLAIGSDELFNYLLELFKENNLAKFVNAKNTSGENILHFLRNQQLQMIENGVDKDNIPGLLDRLSKEAKDCLNAESFIRFDLNDGCSGLMVAVRENDKPLFNEIWGVLKPNEREKLMDATDYKGRSIRFYMLQSYLKYGHLDWLSKEDYFNYFKNPFKHCGEDDCTAIQLSILIEEYDNRLKECSLLKIQAPYEDWKGLFSTNTAYIRERDKLFYANKKENSFIEIKLENEQTLLNFDNKLEVDELSNQGVKLQKNHLDQIQQIIPGHKILEKEFNLLRAYLDRAALGKESIEVKILKQIECSSKTLLNAMLSFGHEVPPDFAANFNQFLDEIKRPNLLNFFIAFGENKMTLLHYSVHRSDLRLFNYILDQFKDNKEALDYLFGIKDKDNNTVYAYVNQCPNEEIRKKVMEPEDELDRLIKNVAPQLDPKAYSLLKKDFSLMLETARGNKLNGEAIIEIEQGKEDLNFKK